MGTVSAISHDAYYYVLNMKEKKVTEEVLSDFLSKYSYPESMRRIARKELKEHLRNINAINMW